MNKDGVVSYSEGLQPEIRTETEVDVSEHDKQSIANSSGGECFVIRGTGHTL